MSISENQDLLGQMLQRLLRPLARFLLKRGFSYAAFAEASKHAFVEAAAADFALPGKRQTTSRVSTLTGLSRKEVSRLQNSVSSQQASNPSKLNRAARVINGWISDERFSDSRGRAKRLEFEQGENSFSQLVKDYSGDITARTIVDELSRINAIEIDSSGKLQLMQHAYIVESGSADGLNMLVDDVTSLFNTIEHNLDAATTGSKRFQRKIYYDRIPSHYIPLLQGMINEKAQACLEEINNSLREYDKDHAAELTDDSDDNVKLGLGIYYIEEKTP